MRATQPKTTAVSGYGAAQVDQALATLATVVAVTRLDLAHLCAAAGTGAIGPYATAGMNTWLADPANRPGTGEFDIQATWTSLFKIAPGCAGDRLVGPGVVLGTQQWTPHPDAGGRGLAVDSVVRSTHLLVDAAGHPQPVASEWRMTYVMVLTNDGWRIATWANDHGWLSGTWTGDAALPSGYLPPTGTAPESDQAAAGALRTALTRWNARPGATTVQRVQSGEAVDHNGEQQSGWTTTEQLAPARGDGTFTIVADGSGQADTGILLGHGRDSYTKTDPARPAVAVPFTAADPKAPWRASTGGRPARVDPVIVGLVAYSTTELLQRVAAAAQEDCPAGLSGPQNPPAAAAAAPPVATCYLALVATTGATGEPEMLLAAHGRGLAYLPVHVGLTTDGSLARAYLDQRSDDLFGSAFTSCLWFVATSDTAPAAVTAPPAGQVADAADFV